MEPLHAIVVNLPEVAMCLTYCARSVAVLVCPCSRMPSVLVGYSAQFAHHKWMLYRSDTLFHIFRRPEIHCGADYCYVRRYARIHFRSLPCAAEIRLMWCAGWGRAQPVADRAHLGWCWTATRMQRRTSPGWKPRRQGRPGPQALMWVDVPSVA